MLYFGLNGILTGAEETADMVCSRELGWYGSKINEALFYYFATEWHYGMDLKCTTCSKANVMLNIK